MAAQTIEWTLDTTGHDTDATWIGVAPSGQRYIIEDIHKMSGALDAPRFLTGSDDSGDNEGAWEPIDGSDTMEEAKQIAEEMEAEWLANPTDRPSTWND